MDANKSKPYRTPVMKNMKITRNEKYMKKLKNTREYHHIIYRVRKRRYIYVYNMQNCI